MANRLPDEVYQAAVDAKAAHGNEMAASRVLGMNRITFRDRCAEAERRGFTPKVSTPAVPDGFRVKGTSTLYDGDGNSKLVWVKTSEDRERQEQMLRETVAAFIEDIKPAKLTPAPKVSNKDICTSYLIGDAHLGLYSWGAETGADFDIELGKRDLMAAADRLVASSPASDECLIVQLGDFYHMDDSRNVTPKSHNQLDVDSRFPKVIRAGIGVMRYTIDRALEKHRQVRVRNVRGNHDPHASIALQESLIGYYSNEPRLIVEDSPRAFWVYRFGLNLVGITHGHTGKVEKLPGVLAVDAQKDWGECEFKMVWHGHIHSKKVFEDMGVTVESFRTLAARDAWHTEQGYRPVREMQAIVLHKEFGEVERHTAGLRRVRAG
jgi:predicted phosphodiesterase